MSLTEAVRSCLTQYATFSGRARRSEYWFFYLATMIATGIGVIALVLVMVVVTALLPSSAEGAISGLATLIFMAGYAGLILPTLAVSTRRLHDVGRSGWWWLVCFIPFVGGIVLLVFFCTDSEPDNVYGPSPKHPTGYLGGYPGAAQSGQQSPYGQAPPPYGQPHPPYGQPPPPYGQPRR